MSSHNPGGAASQLLDPSDYSGSRSRSTTPDPSEHHRGSTVTGTTYVNNDAHDSSGVRGRRMRPSVTATYSQLPAVQDMKAQREKLAFAGDGIDELPSINEKASKFPGVIPEETVSSTKKVLQNFSKVVALDAEREAAHQQRLRNYGDEARHQREVYHRLLKWEERKHSGWVKYILSGFFDCFRQPQQPDREELIAIARHHYPPRAEVKCHVCDYGPGRAEHQVVELGRIEQYFHVKPDWADVRWIHAPLGQGLVHSSVEDIFLHEGKQGRPFEYAGRSGFPYLMAEISNFRHRDNFREMRDVYLLLKDRTDITKELDESTWKADHNSSLQADIAWRAKHTAIEPTYWKLAVSDMPWQLSEGIHMGDDTPTEGLQIIPRNVEEQTITMFDFFKDSHLIGCPFRTFHRGDGFLLTMSPMSGVNYMDKDFSLYLAEPPELAFDNEEISALGLCFKAFADHGSSTWHRRSVEWLLIYILTEVAITPHPMRQGYNAPELHGAYAVVIQELKRRRFEQWQPKVTVRLVRRYLTCLDELTYLTLNLKFKINLFEAALRDAKIFEAEDEKLGKMPQNPDGESMVERLEWAIATLKSDSDCFERSLVDLKGSLDALFQIRSIEQNDRQILSDAQNKAILVFTGVTTIFLPLSFFTSYFGMNLKGVIDIQETQAYFWKICGSIAFVLIVLISLVAFNQHLKRMSRSKLHKTEASMV